MSPWIVGDTHILHQLRLLCAKSLSPVLGHLFVYLKPLLLHDEKVCRSLRQKLPLNMMDWHSRSFGNDYRDAWEPLAPFFETHNLTLWTHSKSAIMMEQTFDKLPMPGGYLLHTIGTPFRSPERVFQHLNGKQHVSRGSDGRDYMITIMCIAGTDDKTLRLEVHYEDIVFGVFPLVQGDVETSFLFAPEYQSLEDVLYIVLQILEATAYIHDKGIAHRDLFLVNLLVEWIPFSLHTATCTRPRVYLIDFESAVEFAEDTPSSARLCRDLPFPANIYKRPKAPELCDAEPLYCPFRLDIWQLGYELRRCIWDTGFLEVDELWVNLMADDPTLRPSAQESLETL